jgi:beta-lactamase class A
LLEASAGSSDNSAADFLLRLVGGPSVVTARMRQLGIAGVRIDRSEGEMALDLWSVSKRLPMEQWTLEMFQRLRKKAAAGEISRGTAAYASDPRDTATPAAMRDLLLKTLQQKLGLSAASNELLIGIMERSPTGAKRVRSVLPPGARWAHKTGTMPGTSNDGGIITLSNGKHLIVVVFVRAGSLQGEARRDQTIAAIAKELIAAAR